MNKCIKKADGKRFIKNILKINFIVFSFGKTALEFIVNCVLYQASIPCLSSSLDGSVHKHGRKFCDMEVIRYSTLHYIFENKIIITGLCLQNLMQLCNKFIREDYSQNNSSMLINGSIR